VRDELLRVMPASRVAVTWGIFAIPFAFYCDRPVFTVDSVADLDGTLRADPRHVAVLSDAALTAAQASRPLRVLLRDRIAGVDVSLVTSPPAPARP
jgi:hypothetical protein